MKQAIKWTGDNAQQICTAISGLDLKPYELGGGVWLKQPEPGTFQLAIPARNGEVYLNEGDFAVQEDDGCWIRLSPEQFEKEYA